MIKVLMVCHGNICRSAAAEMVMRQLIAEAGLEGCIAVDSAAATREEIGNDVYPPMKRVLQAAGVPCVPHAARQTTRADYDRYDYIIGMDQENMRDMRTLYGGDRAGKLSLLMAWASQPGRAVADPWYTHDFDGALRDIQQGCQGLMAKLIKSTEE